MSNTNTLLLHELLYDIVQQFGEEILTENRLKAIVGDMSAGSEVCKYQVVVARSVSDHVGQRLLQLRELDDADFMLRLSTIKQNFQEDNFLQPAVSDYIIDCYQYALGWIDNLEECEDYDAAANAKAGELSFVERNGTEYCGNMSKDNERSGFGVCKKEDGSYYAGEWKLDMKNGVGLEVGVDKDKYVGEWNLNRKNGVGTVVRTDGIRYSGEWKNGKWHGVGTLFYPNGEQMTGRFANGMLQQQVGMYFMQDGSCVVGMMTMNGPDGECTHYKRDGSIEKENWINGLKK